MYGGGGFDTTASQFAGGGFIPQESGHRAGGGGGYDAGDTSGTQSGYRRGGGQSQPLLALTIRQADGAVHVSSGEFHVDGVALHTVTMVGRVTEAVENATTYEMTLHDGTGSIKVTKFKSQEDEAAGSQCDWGKGQPVTDFNEVTYHFLECIQSHLINTKGLVPGGDGGAQLPQPAHIGAQYQPSGLASSAVGGGAAGGGGGGAGSVNDRVLEVFSEPAANQSEPGLNVDHVAAVLRMDKETIKRAVDYLVSEGHLYSTIDDDHFKATGGAIY
eukprot:jgi/Chlat1/381/Chrsp10S01526